MKTRRGLVLALAMVGGSAIGCFSRELTLGDQCTVDSDCGWNGECTQGFCGGCDVIDGNLGACLCTVDLAWSDPEKAYEDCFSALFPAPDTPMCLANKCVVMDGDVPRCNFAYATKTLDEKQRELTVTVAIPECGTVETANICFNVEPITDTCKATGSNVEVIFDYDKGALESPMLGVVCEFEENVSKCESGTDSCYSVDLGDSVTTMGDIPSAEGKRDGTCGGFGSEAAFRWEPPADGSYVFDTVGSDFDTVLYIRESCGGEQIACNDDNESGYTVLRTSRLEVENLTAGQTLYIFVDSYFATGGHFVLNISPA